MYKIKYKDNGEVNRYKSRLVVNGYNQNEGLYYQEYFSPIEKLVIARAVIYLAAE